MIAGRGVEARSGVGRLRRSDPRDVLLGVQVIGQPRDLCGADLLAAGSAEEAGQFEAVFFHLGLGAAVRRSFGGDLSAHVHTSMVAWSHHDNRSPTDIMMWHHDSTSSFSECREFPLAVSKRLRHEIFRRDNHTCQSCGAKAPDVKLEPDHVIPVALGGSDDPSNLQTLCENCNAGKSATPPDAATVAKVAEDALRWSRALDYAATLLLSDQESRQRKREIFLADWRRWRWGTADEPVYAPLPAAWEKSVDQILAAGLPVELLKDCIDTAFAYDKVKPENKFKYACGVAWRKVDKMRDIAKSALNRTDPAVPHASGGTTASELSAEVDHLLTNLFDLLTVDEHKLHEVDAVRALTLAVDEDGDFPIVTALDAALTDMRSDLHVLAMDVDELLQALPGGVGEHAMKVARYQMHDRFNDDLGLITRHRFAEWSARIAVQMLEEIEALAILDQFTEAERAEWGQYAHALHSSRPGARRSKLGAHWALVNAATIARVITEHGRPVWPWMCGAEGVHIPGCPAAGRFRVVTEELVCCAESASPDHGHVVCERHLDLFVEGRYIARTGRHLTARDFFVLDEPEEEEPPF